MHTCTIFLVFYEGTCTHDMYRAPDEVFFIFQLKYASSEDYIVTLLRSTKSSMTPHRHCPNIHQKRTRIRIIKSYM